MLLSITTHKDDATNALKALHLLNIPAEIVNAIDDQATVDINFEEGRDAFAREIVELALVVAKAAGN